MKKIATIAAMFLIGINLSAGRKYLIETEKSIDLIKLINYELGKTIDIFPENDNKTDFFFEVDKIENIFLKFSYNLKIKLYSFNDRVETDWHTVEKEKEVPLKIFFTGQVKKDVVLSDFLINSFRTNHINSPGSTTRGNTIFYTPDYVSFVSPQDIFIAWKSGERVIELKLEDMKGMSKIYSTQSFADTMLQYKDLPEISQDRLQTGHTYYLALKTKSNFSGYKENQIVFKIDSFGFADPSDDLIFVTEQQIEIKWNTHENETLVKVFDDEKNLVFNGKTTRNCWSFNESGMIKFKYGRPYKIELTQGSKSISKKFFVLYNYQYYNKLIEH